MGPTRVKEGHRDPPGGCRPPQTPLQPGGALPPRTPHLGLLGQAAWGLSPVGVLLVPFE